MEGHDAVAARLLADWLRTTGELQAFLDQYVVHGPAAPATMTRHLDRVQALEHRAHVEWETLRSHLTAG